MHIGYSSLGTISALPLLVPPAICTHFLKSYPSLSFILSHSTLYLNALHCHGNTTALIRWLSRLHDRKLTWTLHLLFCPSVTHHKVRLCENPLQLFSIHVFWVTGDCLQHLFGSLNSIAGWISDLWWRPCVDLVIKLEQTNDIILHQQNCLSMITYCRIMSIYTFQYSFRKALDFSFLKMEYFKSIFPIAFYKNLRYPNCLYSFRLVFVFCINVCKKYAFQNFKVNT